MHPKFNNTIARSVVDAKSFQESLEYDYLANSVFDGAVALGKLLLHSQHHDSTLIYTPKGKSDFARWYAGLSGRNQRKVSTWLFSFSGNWYVFQKFGENPAIREIFDILLAQRPAPKYLSVLLLNLIKQILRCSNDTMAEMTFDRRKLCSGFDQLFEQKNSILEWLEKKKQPLTFYGGFTNTVLNIYDEYFISLFPKDDYAAYFDIGGGFNTSDVNRLTGKQFTSLDRLSPLFTDYDDQLIIRKIISDKSRGKITVCLNNKEMETYLENQSRVPWIKTDLSDDSLPATHDSYCIVSTGFMTSTFGLSHKMHEEWCSEPIDKDLKYVVTSLVSMYRVLELVAAGKRVQLFCVNRAGSRVYSHKAVLLEWNGGKITNFKAIPEVYTKNDLMERFSSALG